MPIKKSTGKKISDERKQIWREYYLKQRSGENQGVDVRPVAFECTNCGCKFIANEFEYSTESSTYKSGKITRKVHCACMECFADCVKTISFDYSPSSSSSSDTIETWYVQILGRRVWWTPSGERKKAKDILRTSAEVLDNSYGTTVTITNPAKSESYYTIWNKVNQNYVKGTIIGMKLSTKREMRYWVKTKNGNQNIPSSRTNDKFLTGPIEIKDSNNQKTGKFYLESTAYSGKGGAQYSAPSV